MSHTIEQTTEFLLGLGLTTPQSNVILEEASKENSKVVESVVSQLFPDQVDFPGAEAYTQSIKGNWSYLARREPSAIFHPTSPSQVASVLKALEFFGEKFAIRGGGHSPNPGWAGIQDGLLISTDRLNKLELNAKSGVVSVGAGNRWRDVYKYLDEFKLITTGGHSAPVGCVGQITGCGNSPWFHKYGWSSENVVNFEIVTSGGNILNCNEDDNADLWWALKGGSNNFGIVTRMDMKTFPCPNGVWGGNIYWEHTPETQRNTVAAYHDFAMQRIGVDPGVETLAGWGVFDGHKYIQCVLSADRNVPEGGHPEAFNGFYDLSPGGQAGNCKPSELAAHDVIEEGNEHSPIYFSENTRSSMLNITVKTDLSYLQEAAEIFFETYAESSQTKGAIACLNLSPIAARTIRISNKRGGTAPGWDEEDQTIVFLDNAWIRGEDDDYMLSTGNRCMERLRAAAQKRGVLKPQIWMNNAGPNDDVIGNYAPDNLKRLREIAAKHDPNQTFQILCSGGYKLGQK
ncbi:unnamed protein product [Clonostachys chloroleuca]|uniref:FAD-binding PCMH-type domain-containing protein n=1 Tax=Clonostachys chloroleuca TaxID=1926264 RepID=A0AA35LQV2_9HYPO|nr:unnamed protein product [Clonostachys chloroleuca]